MRNHSPSDVSGDAAKHILNQTKAVEMPIDHINSCAQFAVSKEHSYSMLLEYLRRESGNVRSKIYALCVDQQPHLYYIPNGVALQDYWSIVEHNDASHQGFYRERMEQSSSV